MIDRIRYIWQLLVILSMLLILGVVLVSRIDFELSLNAYLISLFSVAIINLIAYLVMSRGIRKNSREGVVYLLSGIGSKFLLYLLFILVYWLVTKNLSKQFIITFFALYLIFTLFLAGHLSKLLKNK